METIWLLIIALFILSLLILIKTKSKNQLPLPPGPTSIQILGILLSLRQSLSNLKPIINNLHSHYGPIVALRLGSQLLINISDQHLVHSALIAQGATFAGRPKQSPIWEIISANYHTISTATYGPLWGVLRWNKALSLWKIQKEMFMPLIESRRLMRTRRGGNENKTNLDKILQFCYVDTLLDTRLPDNGRVLSDDELFVLCSEFFIAGTDTITTALEWIMAEIVKNQEVQSKVWQEIQLVLANNSTEDINEDMLEKMPYLKAVILESLRLHPPTYFLLDHAVSQECTLGGYIIPQHAWVNFSVADIGRNEEIWKNPTEFKPERFLKGGEGEGVDITGTKEIKMMPFGAGRRICPGMAIAMLQLEYFVANMVKDFEWKNIEGEEVDLTETLEATVVMKKPLRAQLIPRK